MKLIEKYINEFIEKKLKNSDYVYNEFSLQHELGIFLRKKVEKKYRVEFERNIYEFCNGNKKYFVDKPIKKEIDIIIRPFNSFEAKEIIAIELKYPRNGAFPKRMRQFLDDINFLHQLIKSGFKEAYVFTIAEQEPFYKGEIIEKPYSLFRTIDATKNGKLIKNNNAIVKWIKLDENQLNKKGKKCTRMYYLKEIKGVNYEN